MEEAPLEEENLEAEEPLPSWTHPPMAGDFTQDPESDEEEPPLPEFLDAPTRFAQRPLPLANPPESNVEPEPATEAEPEVVPQPPRFTELHPQSWLALLDLAKDQASPALLALLRGTTPLQYQSGILLLGSNNLPLLEAKAGEILPLAQAIFGAAVRVKFQLANHAEDSLITREWQEKLALETAQKERALQDPAIQAIQAIFEGSEIKQIKIKEKNEDVERNGPKSDPQ